MSDETKPFVLKPFELTAWRIPRADVPIVRYTVSAMDEADALRFARLPDVPGGFVGQFEWEVREAKIDNSPVTALSREQVRLAPEMEASIRKLMALIGDIRPAHPAVAEAYRVLAALDAARKTQ